MLNANDERYKQYFFAMGVYATICVTADLARSIGAFLNKKLSKPDVKDGASVQSADLCMEPLTQRKSE